MCLPLSVMYWKDLVAQFKGRGKLLEGIVKDAADAPDIEEAQEVTESNE